MAEDSIITTDVNKNDHPTLRSKSLLNPVERISEILYGLIMALTFTCAISVAESERTDIRSMLIGALGCNVAWGIVDAVMYILGNLAEKGHGRAIIKLVRRTKNFHKANEYIADELPPVISSLLSHKDLETIRLALLNLSEEKLKITISRAEWRTALGIFVIVFLSTFPIVLPFLFITDAQTALRTSNLIAIVLMFICGWFLAKYGGYNKWIMGFALTVLGALLVGLTIVLGG